MARQHIPLPPGAVTGIGSLPFRDPATAVAFVAQTCPYVPFWPELPQRSPTERSIEQVCGPLRDLLEPRTSGPGYDILPGQVPAVLDRLIHAPAHLDPDCSAGFFAFTAALAAGQFPHAVVVKGQLVGPLTLGWHLWHADAPLLAHPVGLAALQHYVARLARWQIARLAPAGKPVLLFLDEPCLALVPPDTLSHTALVAALRAVVTAIRASGVLVGVHTCATAPHGTPSTVLCQVEPDVLSFDAHHGLEAFTADPAAGAFLRAGGRVAFGLIPTWSNLDQVDVNALLLRWLVAAPDTLPVADLARQTLITATCGLGLLPEPAAADSFRLAHALAAHVAQVAEQTM